MVSAAFLAIVAVAIVSTVLRSGRRAASAEARGVALSAAKSAIADAKAKATKRELGVSSGTKPFTLPSGNAPGSLSTVVKKAAGYTNLYSVEVTASYADMDVPQSVALQTLIRSGS